MTTHKPTVVVVEDDENISYLLSFLLTREGYEVLVAADGRAASDLIGTLQPPDLVLLDVMLPYMDGFELYDQIRGKPEWKAVPVVMLTAKSQERDVVRALDAGVIDYVTKPFQPAELVARVRRYMRMKTAA